MGRGSHLGEFEQLVLLAVAGLDRAAHGAAIHAQILEATGRDVSIPAVYVTLGRLESKGHVTTEVDVEGFARGARPRKLFSVTEQAIRELRQARSAQNRLWATLDFDPSIEGDSA